MSTRNGAGFPSYIICGSPRSGSTMLCELLVSSGVAGSPNSFFREPSIAYWCERWGLAIPDDTETPQFNRAYLDAVRQKGSGATGVFGLRIMWGSVADACRRLGSISPSGATDAVALFEEAFGPSLYVHLSRRDKVAQAISLVRAEQSGLWHLAADGSVYEGTDTPRPVTYDFGRIAALHEELYRDDAAWESFFAAHGIAPLRLVYETMSADPRAALGAVLDALGRDPAIAAGVEVGTSRMSDAISLEWAERFRREYAPVA